MMGCEATAVLKWIGDMLSANWEMDYGTVMGWVRARLSFVILHATLLCVWGLVLSCVHLPYLMGHLLLLVSFAFVLFCILNCLVLLVFLCV